MAKKKIKKPAKKSVKKSIPKAKIKKVSTKITHKTTITTTIETNLPSTGSYYIRARKKSWSLYLKTYKDGKPYSYEKIDPSVFYRFSINPSMSAIEAKIKIKEFNKINKGSKIEVARQARAFQRYKHSITINQTLFPPELVALFKQKMANENFGSAEHLQKKEYVFIIAQEIINQLGYTPEIYNENAKTIYKVLSKRKYSVNYSQKIISLLNEWGKFATAKGSGYYKNISMPRGVYRDEIQKQSKNKNGVRKEALPMTQTLLDQISNVGTTRKILNQQEINALKSMFYFGLRPSELLKTKLEGKYFSSVTSLAHGTDVISIYQEKLKGVPEEYKTKHIPVKWKEQIEALKIIKDQDFKMPTYKSIAKIVAILKCNKENKRLSPQSCRKGFQNWCYDKGETSIQAVSSWMGHLDVAMSFKVYRDRDRVLVGQAPIEKAS